MVQHGFRSPVEILPRCGPESYPEDSDAAWSQLPQVMQAQTATTQDQEAWPTPTPGHSARRQLTVALTDGETRRNESRTRSPLGPQPDTAAHSARRGGTEGTAVPGLADRFPGSGCGGKQQIFPQH